MCMIHSSCSTNIAMRSSFICAFREHELFNMGAKWVVVIVYIRVYMLVCAMGLEEGAAMTTRRRVCFCPHPGKSNLFRNPSVIRFAKLARWPLRVGEGGVCGGDGRGATPSVEAVAPHVHVRSELGSGAGVLNGRWGELCRSLYRNCAILLKV